MPYKDPRSKEAKESQRKSYIKNKEKIRARHLKNYYAKHEENRIKRNKSRVKKILNMTPAELDLFRKSQSEASQRTPSYKNKKRKSQYMKDYALKNQEKLDKICKRYQEKNKERIKIRGKLYKENMSPEAIERRKARQRRYAKENRGKINEYYAGKQKNDPQYKLAKTLRCRLRSALNGGYKSGSAIKLLGCSIPELKVYLENKFKDGMSWNNHTRIGWHIDHIKPLSKFDLENPEHLKIVCHYTNLQPLWYVDNIIKSNKMEAA